MQYQVKPTPPGPTAGWRLRSRQVSIVSDPQGMLVPKRRGADLRRRPIVDELSCGLGGLRRGAPPNRRGARRAGGEGGVEVTWRCAWLSPLWVRESLARWRLRWRSSAGGRRTSRQGAGSATRERLDLSRGGAEESGALTGADRGRKGGRRRGNRARTDTPHRRHAPPPVRSGRELARPQS